TGACLLGEMSAAGAASASATCFSPPSASRLTNTESQVFLQDEARTMTGYGRIGSPTGATLVEFSSASPLNLSRESATIKPHASGDDASFGDLNVTIPGATFAELVFNLSLTKTDDENGPYLIITAYD